MVRIMEDVGGRLVDWNGPRRGVWVHVLPGVQGQGVEPIVSSDIVGNPYSCIF